MYIYTQYTASRVTHTYTPKDCRTKKKTIEVGVVKEFFGTGSIPPHVH